MCSLCSSCPLLLIAKECADLWPRIVSSHTLRAPLLPFNLPTLTLRATFPRYRPPTPALSSKCINDMPAAFSPSLALESNLPCCFLAILPGSVCCAPVSSRQLVLTSTLSSCHVDFRLPSPLKMPSASRRSSI